MERYLEDRIKIKGKEKDKEKLSIDELKNLLKEIKRNDVDFKANDEIVDFVEALRRKFDDWERNIYYNLLTSNSPKENEVLITEDFGGDFSIEEFIKDLHNKYVKNKFENK